MLDQHPYIGRDVDQHIGRASTDMSNDISTDMSISTDISVEGFVNYTWSDFITYVFRRYMLALVENKSAKFCLRDLFWSDFVVVVLSV